MQEKQEIPAGAETMELVKALQEGTTLFEANNMDQKLLDSLYGLGHNFYMAKDYHSSEIIFRALCVYKHNESKYWMGVAGSKQGLEDYAGAVEAYYLAALSDGLKNPTPLFYAAHCYLRMGDKVNGINFLNSVLGIENSDNLEYKKYKNKAKELLNVLEIEA